MSPARFPCRWIDGKRACACGSAARQLPAAGSHLPLTSEGTAPPFAGECHQPPTPRHVDMALRKGGGGMSRFPRCVIDSNPSATMRIS